MKFVQHWLLITFAYCAMASASSAQTVHANWTGILAPAAAIDWSTAGVMGGIPTRNAICSTLGAAGQASSFIQSVNVTQINSALSSCPSGQVVFLNPGTYNTAGGHITIPSNVTLRGSGPTMTIINATGNGPGVGGSVCGGCGIIGFGSGSGPGSGHTAITGGMAKGSMSIAVASASGISVGSLLVLTQTNLSYMTEAGDEGTCGWCSVGMVGDSGQTVQVTSVSGNTVGISDPLYIDYTNSPQAYPFSAGATYAGLENLHITAQSGTNYDPNIDFNSAFNSWVENVESDFAVGAHLYLDFSGHNTVRDSFFHDGYSHGPGGDDDELALRAKSSANLIENNIFWRLHTSIMLEWGSSGNVIAYNYSTGNYHETQLTWMLEDVSFHGAHPMMNLFEGNAFTHFQTDTIWGSSSHNTIFRNYSTGSNKYIPPLNTRGALQTGNSTQETANSEAYTIDHLSLYNNLVGVIAGSSYLVNSQGAPSILRSPSGGTSYNPACIAVGYSEGGAPSPNSADSTMLYQGVYNCVDGSFTWANGVQALPASFYLNARPSWWGSVAWPPIGPDVTGGNFPDAVTRGHVYVIPAINCFNSATSNGTTDPGGFDGSTCYASSGVTPPPPSPTPTPTPTPTPPPATPYVITASPASLSFNGQAGAASPACQTISVNDTTPSAPLPILVSASMSWLTTTPSGSSQTRSGGLPVSVCVSVSGLASGSYAGTVTITATGPNSAGEAVNNSPSHVPVMLTITGTGTIPAPLPHRPRTDEND